jgi:hypothetical protein
MPLASALRTNRRADMECTSTQSAIFGLLLARVFGRFGVLLARVFGRSTVTSTHHVSFGVLLVRVFDRSTVVGETYRNVGFPLQLGQRFRDAHPRMIDSEQALLEYQVNQVGIGDSAHDNYPEWEERRGLLAGQWWYERTKLTTRLRRARRARLIRGGMTQSVDEQRAFEHECSKQKSSKELQRHAKELAFEDLEFDEPPESEEVQDRRYEATVANWLCTIPRANLELELEQEQLATQLAGQQQVHADPFFGNLQEMVSTVLFLALYAFAFAIRWRTTARGLFFGFSLLSRWCQSQPCIGDIVHDNLNGNAESVVMSPRPTCTTTGRTRNHRRRPKLPAVVQLRRSPRLMAQQDPVRQQSPRTMAQQDAVPRQSPRLKAQQNTESGRLRSQQNTVPQRSVVEQSTVLRRSARIAARKCATTCRG